MGTIPNIPVSIPECSPDFKNIPLFSKRGFHILYDFLKSLGESWESICTEYYCEVKSANESLDIPEYMSINERSLLYDKVFKTITRLRGNLSGFQYKLIKTLFEKTCITLQEIRLYFDKVYNPDNQNQDFRAPGYFVLNLKLRIAKCDDCTKLIDSLISPLNKIASSGVDLFTGCTNPTQDEIKVRNIILKNVTRFQNIIKELVINLEYVKMSLKELKGSLLMYENIGELNNILNNFILLPSYKICKGIKKEKLYNKLDKFEYKFKESTEILFGATKKTASLPTLIKNPQDRNSISPERDLDIKISVPDFEIVPIFSKSGYAAIIKFLDDIGNEINKTTCIKEERARLDYPKFINEMNKIFTEKRYSTAKRKIKLIKDVIIKCNKYVEKVRDIENRPKRGILEIDDVSGDVSLLSYLIDDISKAYILIDKYTKNSCFAETDRLVTIKKILKQFGKSFKKTYDKLKYLDNSTDFSRFYQLAQSLDFKISRINNELSSSFNNNLSLKSLKTSLLTMTECIDILFGNNI